MNPAADSAVEEGIVAMGPFSSSGSTGSVLPVDPVQRLFPSGKGLAAGGKAPSTGTSSTSSSTSSATVTASDPSQEATVVSSYPTPAPAAICLPLSPPTTGEKGDVSSPAVAGASGSAPAATSSSSSAPSSSVDRPKSNESHSSSSRHHSFPLSPTGSLTGKKRSKRRHVSFSTVQIRRYPMILADNPACLSGPPVMLGWEYEVLPGMSLLDFEAFRLRSRRLHSTHLLLSHYKRLEIVQRSGATPDEIRSCERDMAKIRRQRNISLAMLPLSSVGQFASGAGRKLRRGLTGRRKS